MENNRLAEQQKRQLLCTNKLIEAAVLICTQHEKTVMIWELCTNKLIEAAVLIRTQDEKASDIGSVPK
jgi:hypothetical protein